MRIRIPAICFTAALLLMGCEVRSLRPLVSDKDAIFEPALLGKWVSGVDEPKYTMEFSKIGEKGYELVLETQNGAIHFDARLARLGPSLFLDLSPREGPSTEDRDLDYFYYSHVIPTHSIARIVLEKNTMSLAWLNYDAIKSLCSLGQLDIGHEVLDDDVILTADTPDLQRFLLQHEGDISLLGNPDEFKRLE
jgi:hypothetical protein